MNDEELRTIVRDAVARHLGRAGAPVPVFPGPEGPGLHSAESPGLHLSERSPGASGPGNTPAWRQHASHQLYVSLVNVDGACVIEPSVACDHCGYCRSHGH